MADNFQIRLDPKRRAEWDKARGHETLSAWIKRICDREAVKKEARDANPE
jgi:hypothetical protein